MIPFSIQLLYPQPAKKMVCCAMIMYNPFRCTSLEEEGYKGTEGISEKILQKRDKAIKMLNIDILRI